jgi:fibrillarin-like pre-rRNA processing protein
MVSKLKALLDLKVDVGLEKGQKVLYLGASHGVTAKMVAGIVGKDGFVYCLEVSPVVMRKLLDVCEQNCNMAPLLYDANKPKDYAKYITKVDFIYQDLAQRNQVEIFHKNAQMFLKKGGRFVLIIKSASIDAVKPKREIIKEVNERLLNYECTIIDLEKTHKGHYAVIGSKK